MWRENGKMLRIFRPRNNLIIWYQACQRLMGKASKEGKTLDKTSALSSKTVLDLDRRADEALSRISKEEAGSNRSDVLAAREIMSQVESR